MTKQITFTIDCGETTCGTKERGITCRFFATKRFGTVPVCSLYSVTLFDDEDGQMVQRCTQCLKDVT